MPVPETIRSNLCTVRERIAAAEARFNRASGSVTLLAVSKTQSPSAIIAAAENRQRHFGENYLQEALEKIEALKGYPLTWHYIGAIQSNKTRPIAEHFDWVHGVSSLKVARRLSEQRTASLPDLNVCIQLNISCEASKSGATPDELLPLATAIAKLPRLRLRGLMAIPQRAETFTAQRAIFHQVQQAQQQLIEARIPLDTLSLGMSADLEAAIAAGSTMVRVGTAIFGARKTK